MYKIMMTEKAIQENQENIEELWVQKAVVKFNKSKPDKLYSLEEVKQKLGQK